MLRRSREPDIAPAAERLWDSLSELLRGATRWLASQPAGQGWDEAAQRFRQRSGAVAGDVSTWASDAAHDVGDAAARTRRRLRRLIVDAVLVALLAYLVDWALSEDRGEESA